MPLSERLRIQAGRPFTHTLAARLLVAFFLVLITITVATRDSRHYTGLQLSNNSSELVIASNGIGGGAGNAQTYNTYGR